MMNQPNTGKISATPDSRKCQRLFHHYHCLYIGDGDLNIDEEMLANYTANKTSTVALESKMNTDDVEVVRCRICTKGFNNELALQNHARIQHLSVYLAGDTAAYVERIINTTPIIEENHPSPCTNSESVNGMQPDSMNIVYTIPVPLSDADTVVSDHLDYTVKTEECVETTKTKTAKKPRKQKPEALDIKGPFECTEPSDKMLDGICHMLFSSCCEYSMHYRDEHTRRRKGIRCQVCEKLLDLPEGTTTPYACHTCDQGFETRRELSDHTSQAHVRLKPFQCELCHKRFTQQAGLMQHMRMHSGHRPFACTYCPKAFTQKSGLEQHLRIHTQVRPYKCVVCKKTFCQSVHLKQHMRTHTNVTPFQCAICPKKFKQSSHLNFHLRSHSTSNMSIQQKEKYDALVGLIEASDLVEIECERVYQEVTAAEECIKVENVDEDLVSVVIMDEEQVDPSN